MKLILWHRATCSTSRKILNFLQENGHEVIIRDYILHPPSLDELKDVVHRIGVQPCDIVRKKEAIYQAQYAHKKMTPAACLRAMVAHPILIERPIVIADNRAWLARPADEFIAEWGV